MYLREIPTSIDQGAILRDIPFYGSDINTYGLVITPTCDFAQNKVDLVQLIALFPAWKIFRGFLEDDWKDNDISSKGKTKELREKISRVIKQNTPRYHWLMPLPGTDIPLIADFQNVASLSMSDLNDHEIVACMQTPYLEQVPSRYAAYMGRIGTPDIGKDILDHWIDKTVNVLFPSSGMSPASPTAGIP